ncbi:ras association domain-containing protein 10-like [Lampris incognitus]|uniref:ras association domain-containing protein 10-like n=1 Tax=Lampris incognitus TaxID=2546036 RepID=UPI0024B57620|nr:ras association domain-containing protein 10-like [Lampris incognitus]
MEPEEGKVSVWVCREEKIVSGLSKRTTCADVIKALLGDQNLQDGASAAMLAGPARRYCVVEKWRGLERLLPPATRILRLWTAWGAEQQNVRFVLLRSEASLPSNGPRSAEARVVQSRGGALTGGLQQDKQRRIVRKAFRKLDKMNKKREDSVSKDKSSVEKMETLVHLVISQDHTIRQQIQRLKELDREIDKYEAKVHFDRMKRHGINYVQDTYMADSGTDAPVASDVGIQEPYDAEDALAQFEEYACRCEEVVRLQEELTEREALVESITSHIQEELNQRWMTRRREELAGQDTDSLADSVDLCHGESTITVARPDAESLSEDGLALEEERIKTQLDTSLYIGLRLNTDIDAIRGDLDLSLALWEAKEKELLDLLSKVEMMEVEQTNANLSEDGKQETCSVVTVEDEPASLEKNSGWVEQARGLSKTCSTNDDDSDTGLSSMHSQDSDNPPVCESLV